MKKCTKSARQRPPRSKRSARRRESRPVQGVLGIRELVRESLLSSVRDSVTQTAQQLVEDEHARLDRAPRKQLLDVFNGLGVEVTIDFEKRKVARRDVVPVAARVHFGCGDEPSPTAPPHPDGPEKMCSKVGRGDKI